MKKKRRLLQSDTLWGLTAGLLVLLQFWWLPGEDGSASDSYSTTVDGRLGLYRTLSQLFPRVTRDAVSVVPAQPTATLLIIGPDRYPSESEQKQLYEFVYNGGSLLFAPNWLTGMSSLLSAADSVQLPYLGIELTAGRQPTEEANQTVSPVTPVAPVTPGAPGAPVTPGDGDDSTGFFVKGFPVRATSPLVSGTVRYQSSASLKLPERFDVDVLATSDGGAIEAASWQIGSGRVVVSTSADLFSNRSLLNRESRLFAVRLVEHCLTPVNESTSGTNDRGLNQAEEIVICEYFNASDSYRNTGILFSPMLRSGTLQLLLLAVLGVWMAFYRFGPPQEVTTSQRRSLTESAEAAGNLQYRLRDGGAVVRSYLEYLTNVLRRRYGSSVRLDQPERIAARTGLDPEDVRRRLDEANTLATKGSVSAVQAAGTVRWLSSLLMKLRGSSTSK